MWRFRLLYRLFKAQCVLLDGVGLLNLHYDRSRQRYRRRFGCYHKVFCYMPGTVFILANILQFFLLLDEEQLSARLNERDPGSRPVFDRAEFTRQFLQNLAYIFIIIRHWSKKVQLWQMVDQSQLVYKHLHSILKKRFELRCTWLQLFLGLLQSLVLLVMTSKAILVAWSQNWDLTVMNFIFGIMRLYLVLVLTVQISQHVLHAALLQSLNQLLYQLRLPQELDLLRDLLHVQPMLKRIQSLAGSFFSETFCWLWLMFCIYCGNYVSQFRYDEKSVLQRHMSADDLEDEAEWQGLEPTKTRSRLIAAAGVALMGFLLLLLPLLFAASCHQRHQRSLVKFLWNIKLGSSRAVAGGRSTKDTVSFLLDTAVPLTDYRSPTFSLLAWKPQSHSASVRLSGVWSGVRMLLQVVICTTILDCLLDWQLDHLQH